MITAQQNLRYLIDKKLGGPGLTADARMRDAIRARRCRNLFWNAVAPVVNQNGLAVPNDVIVQAQTQPFGAPVIITDILNFDEVFLQGFYPGLVSQLLRLFTSGVGYQEDFFGAGSLLCSLFTLGHYQSNVAALGMDAPSIKQHFMPYLLHTGEIFQASWELMDFGGGAFGQQRISFNPEIDFRGVRVLAPDDKQGQLCDTLLKSVCAYVERYNSETFILDLAIPTASFPAAGSTAVFTTPLQERPLLVYGIGTNIEGAQVRMRDDNLQWEFVVPPIPPTQTVTGAGLVNGAYPLINGIPLNVVAANGDATLREAYNMLPVAHLLAPNTGLTFRLTNGLRPDGLTTTFTQTMDTIDNFGDSTGGGHIALLCRTV